MQTTAIEELSDDVEKLKDHGFDYELLSNEVKVLGPVSKTLLSCDS